MPSNAHNLLVLGGTATPAAAAPRATLDIDATKMKEPPVAHRLISMGGKCLVHTGHHDECVEGTKEQTAERPATCRAS